MELMDHSKDLVFEIVFLGDSGVGKQELLHSFSRRAGALHSKTTCHSFAEKRFQNDGKSMTLKIWTPSGLRGDEESFLAFMHNTPCRSASSAIVVFDITKRDTFNHIHR